MADPETQELRLEQERRVADERRHVEQATEEQEAITHGRRAERAEYLERKLAERAQSEDERGRTGS